MVLVPGDKTREMEQCGGFSGFFVGTYRPSKGERENDGPDFGLGENETGSTQDLGAGVAETAPAQHSWHGGHTALVLLQT